MKPRFDFAFSMEDYFMTLRSPIYHRPAPVTPHRFTCTRLGVVNPPSRPLAATLAVALRNARLRLAALIPGRPKGSLR